MSCRYRTRLFQRDCTIKGKKDQECIRSTSNAYAAAAAVLRYWARLYGGLLPPGLRVGWPSKPPPLRQVPGVPRRSEL